MQAAKDAYRSTKTLRQNREKILSDAASIVERDEEYLNLLIEGGSPIMKAFEVDYCINAFELQQECQED